MESITRCCAKPCQAMLRPAIPSQAPLGIRAERTKQPGVAGRGPAMPCGAGRGQAKQTKGPLGI